MAYRRRQGVTRAATFTEDLHHDDDDDNDDDDDDDPKKSRHHHHHRSISFGNDTGSLAARAIRASAAHRDSSAYGYAYASADRSSSPSSSSPSSRRRDSNHLQSSSSKGPGASESTSTRDSDDPRYGFWGILAQKAKSILDEDGGESSNGAKSRMNDATTSSQFNRSRQPADGGTRGDNPRLPKGLDAFTSSFNNIGDRLGDAFGEGRTRMEHKTADIIRETRNRTADIIQETRRLHIRRRGGGNSDTPDQATVLRNTSWQRPVLQPVEINPLANHETQLKASRNVAATAAKAKVLLRELKTVKADLAFAKERCAQLEEENKRLRESREKGNYPADDDLIRLQLETLLAEKARLANENSIYARENRFLREIVECHQLTTQDVVYLDENAGEVSEVYPFTIDDAEALFGTPTSPISPSFFPDLAALGLPLVMEEHASDLNEASDLTASSSDPSLAPEVCPSRDSAERAESSKDLTKPQILEDEQIEASLSIQPSLAVADDSKRTAVSSS